jgi:hypothetical protein
VLWVASESEDSRMPYAHLISPTEFADNSRSRSAKVQRRFEKWGSAGGFWEFCSVCFSSVSYSCISSTRPMFIANVS